jgi:hypothetical protein
MSAMQTTITEARRMLSSMETELRVGAGRRALANGRLIYHLDTIGARDRTLIVLEPP